jgi:multidrug efflux pump subunit AcrB
MPTLPQVVRQIGVTAQKNSPNFLLLVNLISPNGTYISDYLRHSDRIHVKDPLKRIPGRGIFSFLSWRVQHARLVDPDA